MQLPRPWYKQDSPRPSAALHANCAQHHHHLCWVGKHWELLCWVPAGCHLSRPAPTHSLQDSLTTKLALDPQQHCTLGWRARRVTVPGPHSPLPTGLATMRNWVILAGCYCIRCLPVSAAPRGSLLLPTAPHHLWSLLPGGSHCCFCFSTPLSFASRLSWFSHFPLTLCPACSFFPAPLFHSCPAFYGFPLSSYSVSCPVSV